MITNQHIGATTAVHHVAGPRDDDGEYHAFIQRINDRFNALAGPVFETDASGLYDAYLAAFPEGAERQYHTCSCCKQFIERFGCLATVNDDGTLQPAMWNAEEAPDHYKPAVEAMARIVRRAELTMPFISSEKMYGTPVTGPWHHFAVQPTASRIFRSNGLNTAFQAASAKREELASVLLALHEYNADTVATALNLLKNDTLQNSDAVLGQAQFLSDLHAARASVRGKAARNLTFRMVALAPSGFCHPRSSMVATLLDDIAAGKSFDQAKAAWAAKMHPLQYQRPQAAPTAGAIKAAEEAFAKLGAATALERRFATMDDVQEFVWKPRAPASAKPAGGVFSSVIAKGESLRAESMRAPAVTMTWEKFQRTILGTADAVEMYAPSERRPFVALTTAVHADARPILQWDREDLRNPVAWYLYHGGSQPHEFNLAAASFHPVTAITLKPTMWNGGGFPHHGEGAILLLEGARDQRKPGAAIFPSTLKAELRPYTATIEAFSNKGTVQEGGGVPACGLLIGKGEGAGVLLRVTSGGQKAEYRIDRWD